MNKLKLLAITSILSLSSLVTFAHALSNGDKFKDWAGQCETIENKKFCGITQTIVDKQKKPIVNLFIRKVEGQKDPILFVKVPLGVTLPAGLGLAVDKKELTQIPFTTCDPAGCNAITPLPKSIASKMKKGGKLQIGMLYADQEIVLEGSLSGFTKALGAL